MIANVVRASVALATLLSAVGCSSRGAAPASPPAHTSRPTSSAAASSGSGPAAGPDVYAHTRAGMFSPVTQGARALVYVPNLADNTVSVLDQSSQQVGT